MQTNSNVSSTIYTKQKIEVAEKEELLSLIDELKEMNGANLVQICWALKTLVDKHQYFHSMLNGKVYRRYDMIAKGQVHPELAAAFNGCEWKLERLATKPMALQDRMANLEKFDVAVQIGNKIVTKKYDVTQMTKAQFGMFLPLDGSGPAPIEEQKIALARTLEEKGIEIAAEVEVAVDKGGFKSDSILVVDGVSHIGASVIKALAEQYGSKIVRF